MSRAHQDLEVLLGSLQAASVDWRRVAKGAAPSYLAQSTYLRCLLAIECAVVALPPQSAAEALVGGGAMAERLVATAVDHAALGVLPRATQLAWVRLLARLVAAVRREGQSLAHVTRRLWEQVRRMGRDHYQRTFTPAAVRATLGIMAVLLRLDPIELRGVLRKDLPHPVKNASVAARVAGLELVPLVIANLIQPPPPSHHHPGEGGGRLEGPVLNADLHEYLRKGLTSAEHGVREAAVAAVRTTLELGVLLDVHTAPVLLEQLTAAMQDAHYTSAKLEADAGVATGHLLRLLQTGALVGRHPSAGSGPAASSAPTSAAPWAYFGGCTAPEAARTIRTLLRPHMSRAQQKALSTAVATLLGLCCPTPALLREAMRAAFVLLVPGDGDHRGYMPQMLAAALTRYAAAQPSNGHRLELVSFLCGYVRRTAEDRAIPHTALIAIAAIMPMLPAPLEVTAQLDADMEAAVRAQPAALMGVASEIAGRLALEVPPYHRKLAGVFARSSRCYMAAAATDSSSGATPLPRELMFAIRTISVAVAAEKEDAKAAALGDSSENSGEEALPRPHSPGSSRLLAGSDSPFVGPMLALVVHLGSTNAPGMPSAASRRTAAAAAGDEEEDVVYQRSEYFFLLAALLLVHCRCGAVTPFMHTKIELAANQFATALVSTPSQSAGCYRAMCAACAFYRQTRCGEDGDCASASGTTANNHSNSSSGRSSSYRSLCIAFLETQLAGSPAAPAAGEEAGLLRLKAEVYRMSARGSWAAGGDEGSRRWLITQALREVESACHDGVPIPVPADELFPRATAAFMSAALRVAPTTAQAARAEAARRAAALVGHGVAELAVRSAAFCCDVFARIDRLVAAVDAALMAATAGGSSSSSSSGGGGDSLCPGLGPTAVVRLWNVLAVVHALQRGAVAAPLAAAREPWAAGHRACTRRWEAVVARWCAVAPSFDLWALGSKVLGGIWCLGLAVDGITARTVIAQQPAAALPSAAAAAVLPLAEAHALFARLHRGRAASTLPMAVSFAADLLKRRGPLGDPCSSPAMCALLGCIALLDAYPADAADAVAGGLAAALLTPEPPAIDPLVRSLVLVALSRLRPLGSREDTAVASASAPVALSRVTTVGGSAAALTAAWARGIASGGSGGCHTCDPHAEAVEVRLVCRLVGDETGAGAAEGPVVARLLATRLTAAMAAGLPDSLSRAFAAAWGRCSGSWAAQGERPLGIVAVAGLIDRAASPATRAAWERVAAEMLRRAQAAENGEGAADGLPRFVAALRAILLARPPDRDEDSLAPTTGGSGDVGGELQGMDEGFAEGLSVGMLGGDGEDPHQRGRKGKGAKGGAGAEAPLCAWSDVAAKRAALGLLLAVINGGREEDVSSPPLPTPLSAALRAAVLDLVVVAVPLVGATPELLRPATDALHAALLELRAAPAASLVRWKIQLVAAVKTVIELSVFQAGTACGLVAAFTAGPLADDGSVRRLARSLAALLATIGRVEGGGVDVPHGGGAVSLALCRLLAEATAVDATTGGPRWPTAAAVAAQGARSPYCQEALAGLCAGVVAAVAVASGFQPPADLLSRHATGEDGAVTVSAGALLRAASAAWDSSNSGSGSALGPSLRHALGCLACLAAAADSPDHWALAAVTPLLAATHQTVVVELGYRRLRAGGSGAGAAAPVSVSPRGALLAVIAGAAARARRDSAAADETASALLESPASLSVADAGRLLLIVLESGSPASGAAARRLAGLVTAEYARLAPARLVAAVAARPFPYEEEGEEEGGPPPPLTAGELLLSERAWVWAAQHYRAGGDAARPSPLRRPELAPGTALLVQSILAGAEDPLALLPVLRGPAAAAGAEAVTARLIAIVGVQSSVPALVHCADVLCHMFAQLLSPGSADPRACQASIQLAVALLISLTDTATTSAPTSAPAPASASASFSSSLGAGSSSANSTSNLPLAVAQVRALVLRPVGAFLVRVVAKRNPHEIRSTIQSLPPAEATALRSFMEVSATSPLPQYP